MSMFSTLYLYGAGSSALPPSLSNRQMFIDLLAGLTVALALVPEAVAFSFVAGVEPLVGLYAAFFVGLITAMVGGRPGMISGATGALAVVMVSLVSQYGVDYLFATVVLMGVMQLIAGLLRWEKFIRMVPHPVMLGFVNGLAIVIGLAQLEQFKIVSASGDKAWVMGQNYDHIGASWANYGHHLADIAHNQAYPSPASRHRSYHCSCDCA